MESNSKMRGCGACFGPAAVPYIVHEEAEARMERITRRLWITVVLLIALLVGTNGLWIWYESQFETIEIRQEFDSGDNYTRSNILMNGTGEIEYGKSDADGADPAEEAGRPFDTEP